MTDTPTPEPARPEPEPEPAPEPEREPVDIHRGPLDEDEDGRWLERDDPRRLAAEKRRGRPFDEVAG
jgi:hypothetical protein